MKIYHLLDLVGVRCHFRLGGEIPIDRGSDRPIIEKGPLDRGSDRPILARSIGPLFKEKGPIDQGSYRPMSDGLNFYASNAIIIGLSDPLSIGPSV